MTEMCEDDVAQGKGVKSAVGRRAREMSQRVMPELGVEG